jgi:uncharacterized LabA/DUF88 family protein
VSDGVAYMTAPTSSSRPRTIVYIDGFNLYFGTLAQSPYRWLDLDRFARLLRPHDDVRKIKYFTAMVFGPTQPNQEAYLKALSTRPSVEVILGNFKNKTVECSNARCPGRPRKVRRFNTREEKRTDVNIALHMLDDMHQGNCDSFVLISGDSDLVPAIDLVLDRMPTAKVSVYIPVPINSPQGDRDRYYKMELRNVATSVRKLPHQLLKHSLLPNSVILPDLSTVSMPGSWASPKGPKPFTFAAQATGQCEWCGKP